MHRTQLPSKSGASGIQSSSKSVRVTGPFCHPSESSRRRNPVVRSQLSMQSLQPSSVGLARTVEGPGAAHPDSSVGLARMPTVRGPSTVIIQGHRIQPEPSTRSQASSNLNFKFTDHASQNCSHPILPGYC